MAALSIAVLAGSGGWYALTMGRESTDDAQVEGRVMNVSARVAGQVLRVRVQDNQLVNAGDVLIELDPADYAAKVDAARADLAAAKASAAGARAALALTEKTAPANIVQAKGGITAATSQVASSHAAIEEAKADFAAADSRKTLASLNLERARALVEQKAIPQVELDSRQTEFDNASAQLEQARARRVSAEAALDGSSGGVVLARGRLRAADTSAEQVEAARAALALAEARVAQTASALAQAELDLSYTMVKAARRGVVSRRSVEEGQMVNPERSLFAIVPLDDVWVVDWDRVDEHHARPRKQARFHLHYQPRRCVWQHRRRPSVAPRAWPRRTPLRPIPRRARRLEAAHRSASVASRLQWEFPLAGIRISRRELLHSFDEEADTGRCGGYEERALMS